MSTPAASYADRETEATGTAQGAQHPTPRRVPERCTRAAAARDGGERPAKNAVKAGDIATPIGVGTLASQAVDGVRGLTSTPVCLVQRSWPAAIDGEGVGGGLAALL